jgi:hypothetical protein
LRRWIEMEGFPPGFYLGKNTRAWHKDDCDHWLANRPTAGPPPDIVKNPPPASPAREASNGRKPKSPLATPTIGDSKELVQPPWDGGSE